MHTRQLHVPCNFSAMDILDIGGECHQKFDVILFTINVITWFQDINTLFRVVSDHPKPKGIMLIHDFHPLMNMLPLPGKDCYCDDAVRLLEHKYFTAEPWIENGGMEYISEDHVSGTFTSFSHSISELVNNAIQSSISVRPLSEYDYDIGLSSVRDVMGLPLSMLLMTEKV